MFWNETDGNNACMGENIYGFSYSKDGFEYNKNVASIIFTFHATVHEFSIHMWDSGDWIPDNFQSSTVTVTGYAAGDN